jgi:N6-L-threonylcarbamoyladenine synthase
MTILGIETSCDETAAALVQDGVTLINQSIATSLQQHQITGGIVPEVAARAQVEYIIPVLNNVLGSQSSVLSQTSKGREDLTAESTNAAATANLTDSITESGSPTLQISVDLRAHIDAIAVTVGPGLIGSLLIGVETAKALSFAWDKPLIPVNHMLGHIYGAWLTFGQDMEQLWPKLALLVSGGHTELILMESHHKYTKVGQTLDDAAGEAFDKVAKLLHLDYPGGPALSKLAQQGNPYAITFPHPMPGKDNFNFSFSGLKTAVFNYLKEHPSANPADIAASFQQTAVDSLVSKTKNAAEYYGAKEVILGGGVAANQLLRTQLPQALNFISCKIPDFAYTTDNAAVIAAAAFYHQNFTPWQQVQANPSLELPTNIDL